MKALILAAGIGTRLLPYTQTLPKPLFTLSGEPIISRVIRSLVTAGVDAIRVNTHHLADQIFNHFKKIRYPVPVRLSHELFILGTGGAIANHADFFDDKPFFIVNGDILTDIDFGSVYRYHLSHKGPVTLVVVDDPEFNSVIAAPSGQVLAIGPAEMHGMPSNVLNLTFTGIQVADKTLLDYLPKTGFSSSIDAYRRMLLDGKPLFAHVANTNYWKDIGTPRRYREASIDYLSCKAFSKAHPEIKKGLKVAQKILLKGDGSDRSWYRLTQGGKTLMAVDHGIRKDLPPQEADAWIGIGRFLRNRRIPVPKIYASDAFSGWAVMQDLGNVSLQDYVRKAPSDLHTKRIYEKVILRLIDLSVRGIQGFDLRWAYQSAIYDQTLILEKECRYFIEAFINGYLKIRFSYNALEKEFLLLSRRAMEHAVFGLMHRDFQSRNILIRNSRVYFIDFQGARVGPIQYDLASLLIDPYVDLPPELQEMLLDFSIRHLGRIRSLDTDRFRDGFGFLAICRNLQALGAFAYLSQAKGKKSFEAYIPAATVSLLNRVNKLPAASFAGLRNLVRFVADKVGF